MRAPIVGLAFAALAACVAPARNPDRSTCVGLFREYDLYAQFNPNGLLGPRSDGARPYPVLSRLAILLRENDCQTRSRDLAALDAVAQARSGTPVSARGAPLGRPVAVHVGAVTSEADAARVVAFFGGLGLRATSIGDRQLGRRVYVGPATTEGALGEIISIAFEAGFAAPYPSQFFRF